LSTDRGIDNVPIIHIGKLPSNKPSAVAEFNEPFFKKPPTVNDPLILVTNRSGTIMLCAPKPKNSEIIPIKIPIMFESHPATRYRPSTILRPRNGLVVSAN